MKTKTLILLVLVVTISCKKENFDIDDLLPKYQPICDVWKPQTMSYDSMGVRVTTPIQYDKLVINDNLSYVLYYDTSNFVVEEGELRIITQTDDALEIEIATFHEPTSSFAGSHLFCSDVVLESLSNDEMILTSVECWHIENVEFHFTKY